MRFVCWDCVINILSLSSFKKAFDFERSNLLQICWQEKVSNFGIGRRAQGNRQSLTSSHAWKLVLLSYASFRFVACLVPLLLRILSNWRYSFIHLRHRRSQTESLISSVALRQVLHLPKDSINQWINLFNVNMHKVYRICTNFLWWLHEIDISEEGL